MIVTAAELRKRGKTVGLFVPMHKHKDIIMSRGKLFSIEFESKLDVFFLTPVS